MDDRSAADINEEALELPAKPAESAGDGKAEAGLDPVVEKSEPAGRSDPAKPAEEPAKKAVIEALIFSSSSPVTDAKIAAAAGLDRAVVKQCIQELNAEYEQEGRAFQIIEVAGGRQLMTRPEYHPYIQQLVKTRSSDKLTRAQLETLAIIAYKQPVIRADIESIRGVQSGQIARNLLERRLIRVVGRDSRLGHPLLYGTTRQFLEVFGLKSIKDLPTIDELKAF